MGSGVWGKVANLESRTTTNLFLRTLVEPINVGTMHYPGVDTIEAMIGEDLARSVGGTYLEIEGGGTRL